MVSYTYSKNTVSECLGALVANTTGPTTISNRGVGRIAYIPGAAGGGAAGGGKHVWSGNPDNRALYYGLAPDDTPQVLNIATTYSLSVGKGERFPNHGGWSNAIPGGWRVTQNWNFQSGVPMYFQSIACNLLYGAHNSCLPDLAGILAAGRPPVACRATGTPICHWQRTSTLPSKCTCRSGGILLTPSITRIWAFPTIPGVCRPMRMEAHMPLTFSVASLAALPGRRQILVPCSSRRS